MAQAQPAPEALGGRRRARLAALAAVLAVGLATHSAAQVPRGSLAGQLLVATEDMADPRFARTVIYLVQHDERGAQGLVLNRPLGEIPLAELMAQMGMRGENVQGRIRLHAGGPVEALRILVLHTADYAAEGTLPVKDGLAVTAQPEILRAIAAGHGPRRAFFAAGYAGWAPGQLEAEMKAGYWVRAQPDEPLVFDEDYAGKWSRALARRKIDL
jgi:putative transcriptional regulator